MVELMRAGFGDPATRRLLDDPYSLSPDRTAEPDPGPEPDLPLWPGAEIAPELAGLWTSGYLMAFYNTRCVRRTNALLGWAYGRQFRYSETTSMGSSSAAPAMAAMTNATIGGSSRFGGCTCGCCRRELELLIQRSRRRRRGSLPRRDLHDDDPRCAVRGDDGPGGDPGYGATAVLLGESALALARTGSGCPTGAVGSTPAAAMGDALLARLPAAGVTIKIKRLS